MKNFRRVVAIVVLLGILCGWYITLFGFGKKVGNIKDYMKLGLDLQGGVYVVLEADTDAKGEELTKLMQQTQSVIEKRVNELGLTNPVVSIEGKNRIRVELPGANDADSAIKSIGKTAKLQFITADGNIILDGSNVKDAGTAMNQDGAGYVVTLEFDSTGAKAFEDATKKIVNNQITANEQIGMQANTIAIVLDNEVISNPSVSTVIGGGKCQIEGNFTQKSASELAALVRGGALPVDLKEVQTSIVGPTLGMDSLSDSVLAAAIGFGIVFLMMLLVYNIMGLAADIALAAYALMYLWLIVAFKAVLTLPGIAGMILTVGMAVDGNVIIFSRIREEVKNGKTIRVATSQGYRRALTTIIDSQVTTLIAGVALYEFGSGDVKGFAVTLMLGTILSIFTSTLVTNLYLLLISENRVFGTNKWFGIRMPEAAAAKASDASSEEVDK
ncbi:MAG: protein translocase subunit SecD [Anaerovoracaceae bacterium]|nr:protein translocase subunit SecD [Bacillota bacterium]MDY2669973.1 protein translocase subunit SecD [Anaerovoracaceae bacterium]